MENNVLIQLSRTSIEVKYLFYIIKDSCTEHNALIQLSRSSIEVKILLFILSKILPQKTRFSHSSILLILHELYCVGAQQKHRQIKRNKKNRIIYL